MAAPAVTLRVSTPRDYNAIRGLVAANFPAPVLRGFQESDGLDESLDEAFGRRARYLTSIAEAQGRVIGFALTVPFRLPGDFGLSPTCTELKYVAVASRFRGRGVGTDLMAHVEGRLDASQTAIAAQIPRSASGFYSGAGWTVGQEQQGLAWMPPDDLIHADLPEPDDGYDFIAVKPLRSGTDVFDFPRGNSKPYDGALRELRRRMMAREIDPYGALSPATQALLMAWLRGQAQAN